VKKTEARTGCDLKDSRCGGSGGYPQFQNKKEKERERPFGPTLRTWGLIKVPVGNSARLGRKYERLRGGSFLIPDEVWEGGNERKVLLKTDVT